MRFFVFVSIFVCCSISVAYAAAPLPLVIWHGMGDSCCNPLSMGRIVDLVKKQVPGIYVLSLEIGNGITEDTLNGFLMPIPKQIELACQKVKADKQLKNGFNVMGFSQGGQFLRALVQQCDGIKVHNLISIGGQHQGIYGFPHCRVDYFKICDYVRRLLSLGAYVPEVQDHLVQAEYWHDPIKEDEYRSDCIFLPDLNNEKVINKKYIQRLTALNKFVMVKFMNDTMVVPKQTEWFGYFAPLTDQKIIPLQETELYKKDRLGLKIMDQAGKLVFLSTHGDHLQFTDQWFIDNIVQYL